MYSRIRNFREDNDWTQTRVAKYLNCSQRVYSNYERGDVDIPTRVLVMLADLYNTSTGYLRERTDDPSPPKKPKRETW